MRRPYLRFLLGGFACVLAITHCGDAYSDPTSHTHDIREHKELAIPIFCSVGYLIILEQARDLEQDEHIKLELYQRGTGIYSAALEYAASIGHSMEEMEAKFQQMYNDMSQADNSAWLPEAAQYDCKGLTNQYAKEYSGWLESV